MARPRRPRKRSEPPKGREHYASLSFRVPLSFHTDIQEVLGTPDEVREMVKKGEIIPAGPGSRWI